MFALRRSITCRSAAGSPRFAQKKVIAPHRIAKDQPRWKPVLWGGGVIVFLNFLYVLVSRYRSRERAPDPNSVLTETVERTLRDDPTLAGAAVRMTAHQLLSAAERPFGSPMVCPPHLVADGKRLQALVEKWTDEFPERSIPDLWVLISCKALKALGGPPVSVTVGRVAENTPPCVLDTRPNAVSENTCDVLQLKRTLVEQGLTINQIVALIGVARGVGFHEAPSPPTFPQQTTRHPYQLDNEYFALLMNENWTELTAGEGYYRCRRSSSGSSRPQGEEDPCNNVAMRAVDVLLLKDPGLRSFVQRYRDDPERFRHAVARLFTHIQERGHNINLLRDVS